MIGSIHKGYTTFNEKVLICAVSVGRSLVVELNVIPIDGITNFLIDGVVTTSFVVSSREIWSLRCMGNQQR